MFSGNVKLILQQLGMNGAYYFMYLKGTSKVYIIHRAIHTFTTDNRKTCSHEGLQY